MRKVQPLQQALTDYRAWITGLRRDQSSRRASTPIVSWDDRHGLVKICPFSNWTEDMMWTYIHAYDLPYNTLHDRGYPSIGCHTCTRAVDGDGDARSGRWVGHAKSECGIHLSLVGSEVRLERVAV
jgi:phosphoadenosine phosphosulfate reductase